MLSTALPCSLVILVHTIQHAAAVEWQGEYIEAKALCVKVVAACGREDLARTLATKHGYVGGTVTLCHEAELRKV